MRILLPFLILVGLGVGLLLNSDLWRESGEPAAGVSPRPAIERVGVLGASASAGVGAANPLAAVLRATLPAEAEVLDRTDPDLARSPRARGERAVRALLEEQPTWVVAADFVFWFAHGAELARVRADDVDHALALLDLFSCPVVVGDLPTLETGEIPATRRPGPAELASLNARIRAWADARDHVSVLALSDPATLRPEWLQPDGLRPNEAGLVELAERAIAAAGLGEAGWHFDPARLGARESGPARLEIEVTDERNTRLRDGALRFSFRPPDRLARTGFERAPLSRWRELTEPLPLAAANPFLRDDLPTELLPGGLEVWAEVPGYVPTDRVPVVLRPGRDTSIRLVAPDPHPLAVRAFDSETGAPLSGVLVVSLTELERRGLDPRWQVPLGVGAGARTDRSGQARLRRLAPRTQRLELHRDGYEIRRAEPVEVGGTLALPLHPLSGGSDVTVRVAGPDGDPLEGAAVGLVAPGAESARWTRVDAEGLARFRGVPAGTALVHLPDWAALRRARGWHGFDRGLSEVRAQLDRRALELEPGTHADATLGFLAATNRGGTLAGTVRGIGGEPVVGAGLLLRAGDESFGIAAVSDERGEFRISDLPEGRYRLQAGGTRHDVEITAGTHRIAVTWVGPEPGEQETEETG